MRVLPLLCLLPLACTSPEETSTVNRRDVVQRPFGRTQDGRLATLYELRAPAGATATLTDFGATLVSLHLPDRDGTLADVVLGFDTVAGYESDANQYFGCIAGRVANRIADARFELGGEVHALEPNDAPHTLHGGNLGFGRRLWQAEPLGREGARGVRFTRTSPAGEEGFPGTLEVTVDYWLTDQHALELEYRATCDAPTVVNLTHHSYFNLAGAGSDTILDHSLQLNAAQYTPCAEGSLIPDGTLAPVAGTPLDFRQPHLVGERIDALTPTAALGYDHNLVLDRAGPGLARAATLKHSGSGRTLELWTTEPGLQFYSGNFLHGQHGKGDQVYAHRSGLCLEAQHFPDSPNQPTFPSIVLRPGETYAQLTVHRFGVE